MRCGKIDQVFEAAQDRKESKQSQANPKTTPAPSFPSAAWSPPFAWSRQIVEHRRDWYSSNLSNLFAAQLSQYISTIRIGIVPFAACARFERNRLLVEFAGASLDQAYKLQTRSTSTHVRLRYSPFISQPATACVPYRSSRVL